MIGKGFRKGGILMKQQLFHHFVAGKIQRLLRLIVVDGLINDIGTVGIQKPFECIRDRMYPLLPQSSHPAAHLLLQLHL